MSFSDDLPPMNLPPGYEAPELPGFGRVVELTGDQLAGQMHVLRQVVEQHAAGKLWHLTIGIDGDGFKVKANGGPWSLGRGETRPA